jgi:hypothetical protein
MSISTTKISKTTIATLSAMTLCCVSSLFFPSGRSFWKEHPGILMVVLGVAGEVVCDWNTEKTLKERLKKLFGILLVAGLLVEIIEAIKADRQIAVLKGQNLALEEKLAFRRISKEQRDKFAFMMAGAPKDVVAVETCIGAGYESEQYASQIKDMLRDAGCTISPSNRGVVGYAMVAPMPTNVAVIVNKSNSVLPEIVVRLQNALWEIGLTNKGINFEPKNVYPVSIRVGAKP